MEVDRMIDESKVKFGDVFLFGTDRLAHMFIGWNPDTDYEEHYGPIWTAVVLRPDGAPSAFVQEHTIGLNQKNSSDDPAWIKS
jgi:hypothetical protein